MSGRRPVLVITCGAIARELGTLVRLNGWEDVEITALDPQLHNRPELIPAAVRQQLAAATSAGRQCFVAYADCGTGGRLDRVLEEFDVERLPGAHCYSFYAGLERFTALSEAEPGTFYLTDFLVRNFERLVHRGLGLDRHPQLLQDYFGNYRQLVYLAQEDDPEFERRARSYAQRLGLSYRLERTGLGVLGKSLGQGLQEGPWRS